MEIRAFYLSISSVLGRYKQNTWLACLPRKWAGFLTELPTSWNKNNSFLTIFSCSCDFIMLLSQVSQGWELRGFSCKLPQFWYVYIEVNFKCLFNIAKDELENNNVLVLIDRVITDKFVHLVEFTDTLPHIMIYYMFVGAIHDYVSFRVIQSITVW